VATDTRARMIAAAVRSLQHDGAEGMSFTDVLRVSGAARGAIYHHFPGGKSQLVAEAATGNGNEIRAALAQLPAGSPAAVVRGFLHLIRPVVQESARGGGCAVAGVADAEAHELASTLITMLEGAHVLARATGEIDCFDQTARVLTTFVESRYGR
jgi:TetR/AcrR family transcriptional repressor of lmrAB and yxaGH operons